MFIFADTIVVAYQFILRIIHVGMHLVSDYFVTFPDCNSNHHTKVERSKIFEHQEFVEICGVLSIYTKSSPRISII